MQPKINKAIERYLDEQLGMWTRLLPWRREMAVHLEEAYEASQIDASEPGGGNVAWQRTLAQFGNVQEVACQLRSEHWPQYIGWRVVAVFVALSVVFSISHPMALIDLPALGFALCPVVVFVLFDTFRGSTRWAFANRIGTWGCVCGAIVGAIGMLADLNNPSNIGSCMALSILSALYCVLLFTPRRLVVVALIGVTVVDFVLMLGGMHASVVAQGFPVTLEGHFWPQNWSVDRSHAMRVLALLGGGVSIGIARFGFHGVARHAHSVGAGIFLLSTVVMLGDMSDPSKIGGHLLVAFGAMSLAIASSHCASGSSRLFRRMLT